MSDKVGKYARVKDFPDMRRLGIARKLVVIVEWPEDGTKCSVRVGNTTYNIHKRSVTVYE